MIWFVGLMVGLILSLPLWFPWILRPLAERYGVHYAGYERGGYGRMVLHNVRFTNQTIHFQAARVETLLPNAYLWQRYLVHTPETVFQASSWTLQIRPAGGASRKGPKPVYSQFQSIETNLARVLSFVPKVALTNGVIDALGQTMTVPYANFSTSGLSAHLVFPKYAQSATLRALLKDGFPSNVQLDSDSLQVNAKVAITWDSSSLRFEATATWLTNRIEAGAQFSPSGFLPDKAYFQAKAFKIPAEVHKLPQFSDFHGSLSGEWLTNGFAVDVSGLATPRVAQQVPPLTLVLRAVGDTNAIFFERAKVSAPWMYAELSEKTRVQFAPPFLTKPTALKLYLDLNRQPWFASRGVLRGEAMLRPGDGKLPPATFNVSGSGIQVSNIQAKSLSVTGAMQWPWLDIPKAVAEFGDGSLLSAQAKFNLEKQEVQNGSVSLVGRFGQQWLPANFSYTNAAVSLQFSGPFKSLSHSGQLQLDHILGTHLCPLNLKGDWRGHRLTFPYLQVEISGGKAVLALQGAANLAAPQKVFRLITLDLRQAGQLGLALQKPFQINFQKLTQREKGSWRASLEPFDWSGSGGKINLAGSLDWPQNGSISASMNRLSSREFEEFFQLPRQRLSIDNLDLSANWTNGPLNFRLGLAANSFLQDNVPFEIKASVAGSAQGVSLTNLSISSQSNLVATAHGFLPLTISPAQLGIQVRPDSPLRLEAQTEPNAIFWNELARLTGTVLENPQLKIQAGGTWNAPHGMVDLQAAKAQFPRAKQPLPEFEQLKLTARIEPESTRIESLTLLVAGQPATVTARIPLRKEFWANLIRKPQLPDWGQGSGHLKIAQAKIAALGPLLPKFLNPQGVLKADLSLLPGGDLDGGFSLDGAATAPLPNLGPISSLELVARFQKRAMNLQAGGTIGGGLVSAKGTVDLQGDAQAFVRHWQKGSLPPFQLRVLGTNVSLVRQAELIVRADLDAILLQTADKPLLLGGTVRLRDSLFLQDVGNLVGGKVATPGSRPPYFSVSKEPFAKCRLDLKLTGEKFMKVQTPVFNGQISAALNLSGTLKDPIALGDVTIDTGEVRFPFASLPVTQGFVSLTSADPYRPHLVINAAGQALGYDIHMQITGPAEKPLLQFSSTPALTSQQILQMLTTGELPRGTYSLSTQQRAQTFAMFVGRSVLSQFGVGSGSANRLTVRSGERFTETGRPTYSVEYKLSTNWSVIGQYDRFNEYNLMLKWKAYSR